MKPQHPNRTLAELTRNFVAAAAMIGVVLIGALLVATVLK
jgi:hypothetical protein